MVERVQDAFRTYRQAIVAHLEAALARARAKEALEVAVAQALLSGEIQGKNAEEREARARALFSHLFEALARAEEDLLRAKAALEAAKSAVEEVQLLAQLRVD